MVRYKQNLHHLFAPLLLLVYTKYFPQHQKEGVTGCFSWL
ncbi:hypothetical protein EVA_12952 [gut metagenome]|uniref:Uncharacterized protein n=1 Tax=gut metagenome TaxID=749906 RepID=J9GAY4_9ZZZZ